VEAVSAGVAARTLAALQAATEEDNRFNKVADKVRVGW
jgi:hypothetical protein